MEIPVAHILIIDDDNSLRLILRTFLKKAGYQIIEASNGKKGVQLFRQQPVELVITDISMPVQDGYETIIQLKQEFPTVKIFAISGSSEALHEKNFLPATNGFGVMYSFVKPISLKELLTAIQEVLEKPVG